MAMTLQDLTSLLDRAELQYFTDPRNPTVMMQFGGMTGSFQMVAMLQLGGEFLQFRTINNPRCPKDHPHSAVMLQALAHMNYQMRFVKLGWDPQDGELVAYGDVWLTDQKLDDKAFHRIMQALVPGIDFGLGRLRVIMDTGKDPGPEPKDIAAAAAGGSSGLSDKVRRMIDDLLGDKKDPEPSAGPDEI